MENDAEQNRIKLNQSEYCPVKNLAHNVCALQRVLGSQWFEHEQHDYHYNVKQPSMAECFAYECEDVNRGRDRQFGGIKSG